MLLSRSTLPVLSTIIRRTMSSSSTTRQEIRTPLAPEPIGPYSQAIRSGNTVYLSGQIAKNVQTGQLVLEPFDRQADQVFSNLRTVVEAAGGRLDQVVKLTIFILDFGNFQAVNQSMEKYFRPPYPARSTIGVASLPAGVGIEVEAILQL
ncbi:2-iminobutanoate/2-iminopropanoate deaminase-like [Oppia nitens]|uniref:2-iminobutanoate/2-iminopropanoate deaminase-like n=1 Tax=Oppia nitens TaxID=1686743 RepID=UPI0023DA4315|nr:2-iminobutanoate/2-iminopropanoate deaminase-like [Oppia nitens]